MLQLGILTPCQYARASKQRRLSGSGVSFNLLELSNPPTTEELWRFDEINSVLRTSNGTTRTTFGHRMVDVDQLAVRLMRQNCHSDDQLVVQDRAASNCLTSVRWAEQLLPIFRRARFEASDALVYLLRISLPGDRFYFLEPNGLPVQYVKRPFAVCLHPREPYRYILNHIVAALAKHSFRRLSLPHKLGDSMKTSEYQIDKISCIHPEARSLSFKEPRFEVCERSVFQITPGVDVLRTMNILNLAYFTANQIGHGIHAAFQSLKPGGLWIIGRTLLENGKNHVTFFRRKQVGWEILERIGDGSEIEELVARGGVPPAI